MTTDLPHPQQRAVDATAQAFIAVVAEARKLDEVPDLGSLDALGQLTARNTALRLLTPAAPSLSAHVARTLATDLDAQGHHDAATRLVAIATSWDMQFPDDVTFG